VSGKDPQGRKKLDELLEALARYRSELETAERGGDLLLAKSARRLVRIHHGIIRRHCDATGIPLPADVPKED
jgi:hypothetical protein